MSTPPEPDETRAPVERTPRRWKPFGDSPPAPRVGSRVPVPRPEQGAPRARRRRVPLWLPPVAGLGLGALIALAFALASSPSPSPPAADGPVAIGPPPTSGEVGERATHDEPRTADDGGGEVLTPPDPDDLAASDPDRAPAARGSLVPPTPYAFPRKLVPPARGPYAGRQAFDVEGPRRVGDLKPNPYWESIWGERRHAPWRFERVGPLKPNPYDGSGD